jgi:hypothetical protein
MAPTAPPSTTVDMLPLLSGTGEKSAVLRTSDPFATMAMRMLISGSDRLYYEGNTPFPVGLGVGFDGYVNGSDQLVVLFERPAFLVSFQISGNGVGWSHLVLLLPPKKSRQSTEPAYQLETREVTGASSYWAARGKQVPLGFVLRMTTPIGNVRLDSFSVQEHADPDEPTTAEPSTVANTTTTAATTEAIGAPPESALPPWIWYAVGGGGGCLLLTLIIVVVVVVVRKRRASPSTSAGGTEMSSARDVVDDESKYRSAVQDPRGIYVSSGTSSAQFRAGYGAGPACVDVGLGSIPCRLRDHAGRSVGVIVGRERAVSPVVRRARPTHRGSSAPATAVHQRRRTTARRVEPTTSCSARHRIRCRAARAARCKRAAAITTRRPRNQCHSNRKIDMICTLHLRPVINESIVKSSFIQKHKTFEE